MTTVRLTRQSPFSFACDRCGRCCHGQAIQLNGYEIARLALALGLCTTETIHKHAVNGGQFLRFADDGSCPFLGPEGCRVHAHRPLACRLYPLGREADAASGEEYVLLERRGECSGALGQEGRVGDYLAGQGAEAFLRAFDLYAQAARRFLGLPRAVREALASRLAWFNADWACAQSGLDVLPLDPWRKMEAHLAWLGEMMDQAHDRPDLT